MSPLRTGSTFYHNIAFSFAVDDRFTFRLAMDNVFDRKPPPGVTGSVDQNQGGYDVVGRFLSAGVTARF